MNSVKRKMTGNCRRDRYLCCAEFVLVWLAADTLFLFYRWNGTNGTVHAARYAAKDCDGFDYSVKWPDYLSFTGNFAVGFPGTSEDPFTDGLIIWPKIFGGYEYGVILKDPNDPSNGYMFYITPDGQAIDAEYQEIAVQCRTIQYAMI